MLTYAQAFALLWLYRYIRLIVSAISFYTFRPIEIPLAPTLFSYDVSFVVSTVSAGGKDFVKCLVSILATCPFTVIVTTVGGHIEVIRTLVRDHNLSNVQVVGVPHANKRLQMLRALESVRTTMTVFVDDDVLLPITFLGHILAPFEDPLVGAAGCFATVSRIRNPSLVHMLGAFRLQRRNFDTSSTAHIDGGISTISGRTFTVRSSIVKCRHFAKEFANELFLNRYPLVTADDDKFLTRWVCAHDWKVVVQSSKYAEIETTFEECPRKFSMQCLRWARTRLRGNISTLALESYPWRQPWSLYAIYFRTFTPPAAVMDGTLAYLLYKAIQSNASVETTTIMMVFALWVVFSKTIKLLPHLYRYPLDVRFIPGQVLFAYLHGIVEIYAAVTFNKTGWGTRNLGTHAENLHDNCVRWITKVSKPRVTDVSEEKEK